MNMQRNVLVSIVVVLSLLDSSRESRATVLQFDQTRDSATQTTVQPINAGSNVQKDYGDNVIGSPMNVPGGSSHTGMRVNALLPTWWPIISRTPASAFGPFRMVT